MEIIETLRSLKKTHDCLEISYEEDVIKNPLFHNRLYDFLDLQKMDPSWLDSQKVAPEPWEFISNYESVKEIEPTLLETGQTIESAVNDKSAIRQVLEKMLSLVTLGKFNPR